MKKNSSFRLELVFLLLSTGMCLQAHAVDDGRSAPPQTTYDVDITLRAATLLTFTEAFTRQTGVLFSYESALSSAVLGDVSIREKKAPLERILDDVFKNRGYRYKIVDRIVVLTYDPAGTATTKVVVRGTVTDPSGAPMVGATVVVKDTMRGTTVGADVYRLC